MTDKPKIPAEAVELYTRFIHGEISRRAFVSGVKGFAVAGLTSGALIEALMPKYAEAQQIREDDNRIKATWETVPSPDGNGYIRGYLVRPFSADTRSATPAKLPGVIVIHENRGLNPHTMDVARRFALENFMAFAPDALTSVGGYPGDDFKGGQLFSQINAPKRTADFVNAARWLKARPDCNGKIASTGFCFGGRLTNQLAAILGEDLAAGAPFYGAQTPPADVAKIKGRDADQPRRARYQSGQRLSCPDRRAEEEQHRTRRASLPQLGPRLLQRRHARALQQGDGR